MRNTFGKIQSVSNQFKMQLNFSTMATLGAEVDVIKRWPLKKFN